MNRKPKRVEEIDKMRKTLFVPLCMIMVMVVILAACGHQHIWQEATCITPKTCAECGETEGEALGHEWVAATCQHPEYCSICETTKNSILGDHKCNTWSEIQNPTCTETGFKKGTCINCGQEFVVIVDKAPHDYGEWEITKEASCVDSGERNHICAICGYEESEEIAPIEHDLDEWKVTKEATYNENGAKEQKCLVCGNVINTEEFSFTDTIKDKVELTGETSGITATDAQISYISSWGYISAQAIIELTNSSDSSIRISKTNVDVVDNDGALLETVEDYYNLAPAIIEPGQKGYILAELFEAGDELDISNGLDVKAYVTVEKTQEERSQWEFTDIKTKGNDPETVGHIKNADKTAYSSYIVYCLYRDETGRVIGFTTAYGNNEIAPDETESFGSYNSCSGLIKASNIVSVECVGVGYSS